MYEHTLTASLFEKKVYKKDCYVHFYYTLVCKYVSAVQMITSLICNNLSLHKHSLLRLGDNKLIPFLNHLKHEKESFECLGKKTTPPISTLVSYYNKKGKGPTS